jgi:hypothetical protein
MIQNNILYYNRKRFGNASPNRFSHAHKLRFVVTISCFQSSNDIDVVSIIQYLAALLLRGFSFLEKKHKNHLALS